MAVRLQNIGLLLTLFYILIFTFMSWFGKSNADGYKLFVALLTLFITSLISTANYCRNFSFYFIIYNYKYVFQKYLYSETK